MLKLIKKWIESIMKILNIHSKHYQVSFHWQIVIKHNYKCKIFLLAVINKIIKVFVTPHDQVEKDIE